VRGAAIALEAYSPLGTGRHLGDARVGSIAERYGRTPAQDPDPLVPGARARGAAEVDASRADRRQRRRFRLSRSRSRTSRRWTPSTRRGGTAEALERKWW
jgi:hypothetical protein